MEKSAHSRPPILHLSLVCLLLLALTPVSAEQSLFYTKQGFDEGDVIFCCPSLHFYKSLAVNVETEGLSIRLSEIAPGEFARRGIFTSPIVKVPAFSTIMASYFAKTPPGTTVEFQLRFIVGKESTEWITFAREEDALLESKTEYLQYRVTLTSNTGSASPRFDEASFLLELEKALPKEGDGATVTPQSRAVSPPTIVERSAWGAASPSSSYSNHTPRTIIVHHTAAPTAAQYQGVTTIRGIQRYHMNSNHWLDIGYHMLIGPTGKVYRGRPEHVSGAHCPPNSTRLGVSVVGHYTNETPSTVSMDRLVRTLAYWCAKYGISPKKIWGHEDFANKDCPGKNIYRRLPEIRKAVQDLMRRSSFPHEDVD